MVENSAHLFPLAGRVQILSVLVGVEADAEGARVAGQLRTLADAVLDDAPACVQHALHLAAPHAHHARLRKEWLLVVVLGAWNRDKATKI